MLSGRLTRYIAAGAAAIAVAIGAYAIDNSSSSSSTSGTAVHIIGTSGPHHVFVNKDVKVTGAA
jgi:hypothetical protein